MRRARSCAGRACIQPNRGVAAGPRRRALAALARPRGRKQPDTRDAEIACLRKEKERLELELAKARFMMDVQAELQALLGEAERAETEPHLQMTCRARGSFRAVSRWMG